jgi:hypothetical protein
MRERRRNVVTVFGLYWGSRLLSLGAGVGTGLGLKSAGWTFLPRVAVALAVLLGVYRVLVRLVLFYARHLDSPG